MKKLIALALTTIFALNINAQEDTQAKTILDNLSKKTKAFTSIKADFQFTVSNKKDGVNETQEGSIQLKGNKYNLGRKISLVTREKMSQAQRGENHYRWNPNREAVRRDLRNDPIYKQWSKCVKSRDFWKCKISNKDCSGKVVAHHILPWAKFPELRYEINNGITLCHTHHPKKRNDEIIFAPVFQKMVSNILAN